MNRVWYQYTIIKEKFKKALKYYALVLEIFYIIHHATWKVRISCTNSFCSKLLKSSKTFWKLIIVPTCKYYISFITFEISNDSFVVFIIIQNSKTCSLKPLKKYVCIPFTGNIIEYKTFANKLMDSIKRMCPMRRGEGKLRSPPDHQMQMACISPWLRGLVRDSDLHLALPCPLGAIQLRPERSI